MRVIPQRSHNRIATPPPWVVSLAAAGSLPRAPGRPATPVMTLPRKGPLVTKSPDALVGDVLAYALAAAIGQTVSHLTLASDPKLPETWEQLVTRYTAGSAIVAATVTLYALRHPSASARDATILHWGVLLGCGGAVAALHLADWLRERAEERAEARAMDVAYDREDGRHVASSAPPRAPISLSFRGRA